MKSSQQACGACPAVGNARGRRERPCRAAQPRQPLWPLPSVPADELPAPKPPRAAAGEGSPSHAAWAGAGTALCPSQHLPCLQQHRVLQSTAAEPGKSTGCGSAKGKASSPRARSGEAAVLPAEGMQLPETNFFSAVMEEALGPTLRPAADVWEKPSVSAPRTQPSPVAGKAHPRQ